jgi:hypothetical protein
VFVGVAAPFLPRDLQGLCQGGGVTRAPNAACPGPRLGKTFLALWDEPEQKGSWLDGTRLLDERSRPHFREVYGYHAARSVALDAAVGRIRLAGMSLGLRELKGLKRIRLLLAEMNALSFGAEADALAAHPARRSRLAFLSSLLDENRLDVRTAPLAGWSPDFSVFHGPGSSVCDGTLGDPVLMVGPHWFESPYPHRGPAFGVVLAGPPAARAGARFEELWGSGHDVRAPVKGLFHEVLRRAMPSF